MTTPLQATIETIKTLGDRTVELKVSTQEVSSDQALSLFEMRNKLGWLFFQEAPITQIYTSQLPKLTTIKGTKTKSQVLRAVIFRLWEQNPQGYSSEEHYEDYMEKLINLLKEKLN